MSPDFILGLFLFISLIVNIIILGENIRWSSVLKEFSESVESYVNSYKQVEVAAGILNNNTDQIIKINDNMLSRLSTLEHAQLNILNLLQIYSLALQLTPPTAKTLGLEDVDNT